MRVSRATPRNGAEPAGVRERRRDGFSDRWQYGPPLRDILAKLTDAGLKLTIDAPAVPNAHGVIVTDDDPFWGAMNAKADGTRNEHRGRQHVREG